ncbi:hypothetical protein B7R25_05440 [Subtercola boreus]|uniref:MmpS family membrane protein n=1 Tax=Subtercola boreus TaxID=120213 RepID=A0A3E0WFB0_9MICO|nr:hypothetical protein B7R24_05370 [Subtercola boreus]RFA22290.1 hypothetical protein B7R23_05315 [Subtercola boreus]RFA28154.1 hypothetical protein B7R25_05440 [Subtercola boreus]
MVVVVVVVVLGAVLLGTAVAVAVLLGPGLDLAFIGLIFGFLLFGVLSAALRFFPDSLPLVPSARRILSFLSLAALAGLLYLYVYPAVTHSSFAGPDGTYQNGPGVGTTRQATVVYSLTGDGGASIGAASPLPSGETVPASVHQLPWDHPVQLTVNAKNPGLFTLIASGLPVDDDSALACTITVDGVVVAHDESSGAHRSVFCSGKPQ